VILFSYIIITLGGGLCEVTNAIYGDTKEVNIVISGKYYGVANVAWAYYGLYNVEGNYGIL